ncbi:MAG: anti-sigma factor family protein [Vicinamibacterales bacterium]
MLVAYLYGEMDADGRREVERHLRSCAACAHEAEGLQTVRQDLQLWLPPEPELGFTIVQKSMAVPQPSRWAAIRALPAWAQVAAAVLVIAAGAALANLQVRYGDAGLTVATGWLPAPVSPPAPVRVASTPLEDWRPALTALERDLRTDLEQMRRTGATESGAIRASAPATTDSAAILRRVQTMLDESEQRQRQELAVRLLQLNREVEMRRRADLVNINHSFGALTGRTFKAEAGQQEVVNYLRRVATQPIP